MIQFSLLGDGLPKFRGRTPVVTMVEENAREGRKSKGGGVIVCRLVFVPATLVCAKWGNNSIIDTKI